MLEIVISLLISLLILLFFFLAMGAIFLALLRGNKKWKFVLTAGFIYCGVILTPFLFYTKKYTGQDLVQYGVSQMQSIMDSTMAYSKSKGWLSPEDEAAEKIKNDLFYIRPFAAWCMLSLMFVVFLNYFVVKLFVLKKYGISDDMPPFELWYLDEKIIWLFLACLFAAVFKDVVRNDAIQAVAYNSAFLLANIYFITGLSVAAFYFLKFKVSGLMQFFFYFLIVVWPFLMALIILTGILDTWFNFRRVEKGGVAWK